METGLQGQLKKSQLPIGMGDLIPRWEADNRAWWRNIDLILVSYLTPAAAAAALLPSEFSLPHLHAEGLVAKLGLAIEKFRTGGELAAVSLVFAKYRDGGTLEPYNEVLVGIPCLYQGKPYGYCPHIYVDTDQAMAAGRELLGYPKKIATFELNSSGAEFTGTMDRRGKRVVSIRFKQKDKLFSLPLPPSEKLTLPAPYDQVFVLPEPTGKPQGFPSPMFSTRFVGVPQPLGLAPQHIYTLWKWEKGTVWAGEGSIEYGQSDADPLAKLPVVHLLAAALFKGDMSLYGDESRVLTEMA